MREAALDADNNRLVLLVADHHALERSLRHEILLLPLRLGPGCQARLGTIRYGRTRLRGGKRQRLLGELDRDAIDLEQDAAGLDAANPELDGALAGAHANFERLLR